MKIKLVGCIGNYLWFSRPNEIWEPRRKGKFFSGIYTGLLEYKVNRYKILGFRLCKKELK